ncbi:hypothetical protein LSH36_200g02038 [Paralvinella palmiformis]|uniref:CUB domain-containing protein n=1 Tax=Paralvinella palmiformis TaxID=53620 RepID=A0AAD9N516_9ANNE|nr:hypothetical protein LSH36_200g02038 [Paralvinella palmiformis]
MDICRLLHRLMAMTMICLAMSCLVIINTANCITVDVCPGYEFSATCTSDALIVMELAELGRMEPGSHITDEIGCGSIRAPWIIQARHGETVEISLLDFKALDRARSLSVVTCSDIYGFVVEKTLNINQTICGQNTRESVIYRSKTNSVEIYIVKDSGSNFMIKYTGNGCSDPKPPPQAWYKRNGNEAVIGCEVSDKEWRLTCSGNRWHGKIGNCTISVTMDVCTGYEFSAKCQGNELIVMEEAMLGRMDPGKCLSDETGNFGCKNDVLFLTDRWCSGRKQCEFTSPNREIMDANTECSRDLAVYLRASYSCVENEIGCGSTRSPWIIRAKHGQTVELSLLDFKALDRARSHSLVTCSDIYGFVVEKTLNINQTICGQNTRESVIYRSKTNSVEIYIVKDSGSKFLIKYTANGCSDPKPPPQAWYKRNGNEAVIGCEASDKEWRLTCSGNRWHGKIGNCTTSGKMRSRFTNALFELSTIVIVAGIIGGTIVLAVAVIVCGVVYIQKYKDRKEKKYNESLNHENMTISRPPTSLAHSKHISSKMVEGQDDYLEPNTNTGSEKLQPNVDEPLIHIWETPLPDPTNPNRMPTSRECTVHRKPKEGQTLSRSNPTALRKDHIRTGTSYYSPNTGHKYYVVDREITMDVCIGYEFTAKCQGNELIVMEEAMLGRMDPGKCLPDETGNFGCKNDVLFLTDRWCSGRKQCEFTSPNREIMDANTECSRGLAVYLRASYSCVATNGCSDPKPPPQAWYKRNGNEAVIGCEASDKEWRLTCSGNRWHGKIGNCTTSAGIIGGTIVLAVAVIVCGVVYIQKYKDRKEKKYNESLNQENMMISQPPTSLAHSRHISSKMVEGQDDYLEPNSNTGSEKLQPNVDEPLIHIWETPLPDPTNPNRMPTSRECTIHRKPREGQTLSGSNPTALRKDHIRTGTSYYSPNTGHKYYVVDRET